MTDTSTNPNLLGGAAERRAFFANLGEGIGYFIPPEVRPLFQFAAEITPSATVERASQASRRMFQPDRTAIERFGDFGDMLSETAGVVAPVAVAGRAAMPAAQAAQEAFLGVSVPARAAADTVFERLNQPGQMPETLYSNPRFDDIIRGIGRARDNARRADSPNPDIVPRTADPDVALSDFARARERMLGASNDLSFGELQGLIDAQAAARRGVVEALSSEPSVRLFNRNDRAAVVGPGMGPGEEGRFRVTYFDADRRPTNHTVYETKEEALNAALREGFDSRTAAPTPSDFGFRQDNPALSRGDTEWLANKQRVADERYAESRGITGSTTAQLGHTRDADMFLPTDFLRRIPGLNRENRRPGDPKYDDLLRDVQRRGFLPDQDSNRVVLGINHRGEPFLLEGNTRVAVANDVGVPNVRVEVVYKNGGEMVDGPFAPQNIARLAARGPEGFAQGGPVTRPEPRPITLGAVPTGEMTRFGRPVFENPSSDRFSELTVTVPYGDRFVVAPSIYVEGGRPRVLSDAEVMEMLARHGPVDLMTNQELPTFSTIEEADAYARSRSDAMFGPEGFADGGEVFRGIGSLTSVARGMFGA